MSFPGFVPDPDFLYWFNPSTRRVSRLPRSHYNPFPVYVPSIPWPSFFPADFEFARWHRLSMTGLVLPETTPSTAASSSYVYLYTATAALTVTITGNLIFGQPPRMVRTSGPHFSFFDFTDLVVGSAVVSLPPGTTVPSGREVHSLQPLETGAGIPLTYLRRVPLDRATPTS